MIWLVRKVQWTSFDHTTVKTNTGSHPNSKVKHCWVLKASDLGTLDLQQCEISELQKMEIRNFDDIIRSVLKIDGQDVEVQVPEDSRCQV